MASSCSLKIFLSRSVCMSVWMYMYSRRFSCLPFIEWLPPTPCWTRTPHPCSTRTLPHRLWHQPLPLRLWVDYNYNENRDSYSILSSCVSGFLSSLALGLCFPSRLGVSCIGSLSPHVAAHASISSSCAFQVLLWSTHLSHIHAEASIRLCAQAPCHCTYGLHRILAPCPWLRALARVTNTPCSCLKPICLHVAAMAPCHVPSSLGAATSHGIVPMTHQVISLDKALRPYATLLLS